MLSSNPEKSITGSGYGLKNIGERIKLTFGKLYGICFISQIGEGTTVVINISYICVKFKEITGKTFTRYLTECRIEGSLELLKDKITKLIT